MAINNIMQSSTFGSVQATHKTSWADVVDDDDEDLGSLPPPYTIGPDGAKKTISYKYNEQGKQVKVTTTTKIRNVRLSKHAAERRSWVKFGDAAHEDSSSKLTVVSTEEIFLTRPELSIEPGKKDGTLLCRTCKGEHWTARCPYKDVTPNPDTLIPDTPGANAPTKYVPPRSRRDGSGSVYRRDEENSVKVSNLSEDAQEADLRELFSRFGPLSRVYVVTDRATGLSRGFAFINFIHRDDAQVAIDKLNGYGYANLILEVDWATPRTPR
ncbi:hypothetical protein ACHQM5_010912 [Ranunculus cassubicifolius]